MSGNNRVRTQAKTPTQAKVKRWTWTHTISLLAALAALGAGGVSYLSYQTAQRAADVAESTQNEERFNNAVQNLGNRDSVDARLGGVYQLASLMHDAPKYNPSVIKQLAAFVQINAPLSNCSNVSWSVPSDVQEALSVIGNNNRPPAKSSMHFSSDLSRTCLRNANMVSMNFERANFTQTDLTGAELSGTSMSGAYAFGANLDGVTMISGDLTCSVLTKVKLTDSMVFGVKLMGADMIAADLTGTTMHESDLSDANIEGAIINESQVKTLAKPLNTPKPYCFPPDHYGPIIPDLNDK